MKLFRSLSQIVLLLAFSSNVVFAQTSLEDISRSKHLVFKHMKEVKDCYFCHLKNNLNLLHLLDGTPISYDNSTLLCGQCHGTKEHDWNIGIHGKQTKAWGTGKKSMACTACHEAHNPKFSKMKAFKPPKHPKFSIEKGAKHERAK